MAITVPDKRSRILEVVIVRRLFNLGTGNLERGGNGKGLRKGEYFLELLMREAPLGKPNSTSDKVNQPAVKEESVKDKAASAKGKGKKKKQEIPL
jgi:hypothetical protein